jgi:anti-sigma regulatory factor (Ser/Thr protein kinase)
VIRDITERTERERELRRRKDLLVRTERMADVGGWELDLDAWQIYWTEGARLIHEAPEEFEPTPASALEFFHPEDRELLNRAIARCRDTGEPFDEEVRLITAEGRERWINIRGEAVEENGTEKVRGTLRDITEVRENEQQLTVLNRVLRHNLRNDAGVVHGYGELLVERLEDPELARMADAIERRAGALAALGEKAGTVERLLTEGETNAVAVDELVENVVADARETDPDATVELEVASDAEPGTSRAPRRGPPASGPTRSARSSRTPSRTPSSTTTARASSARTARRGSE